MNIPEFNQEQVKQQIQSIPTQERLKVLQAVADLPNKWSQPDRELQVNMTKRQRDFKETEQSQNSPSKHPKVDVICKWMY